VTLTVLLPPSGGSVRAEARAEIVRDALAKVLQGPPTVTVAATYADIVARLADGTCDVAWAPPIVAAQAEGHVRAALQCVRNGRSTYRSVLVALASRKLAVDGLSGTKAAWVDPLSIGGYLLVRALLLVRGVDPDATFAEQRFAGSYPEALRLVLDREADVCALTAADESREALTVSVAQYASARNANRLEIVACTEPSPNDAIVLGAHVPAAEVDRWRARLLGSELPRIRTAFTLAFECSGFAETAPAIFAPLRDLVPSGALRRGGASPGTPADGLSAGRPSSLPRRS
jgi:ABC-type phosphate/phosphonate transport system substrate-binding protein